MLKKKPRAVLLTDSLGCPRDEIAVDNMWTDQILSEFGDRITFYSSCIYGLSVKDIPIDYIRYLEPDLLICQIGIVDACRRALTVKEEKRISKIPVFRRLIKGVCSRKHYTITKIRNKHRANMREFSDALDSLINIANMKIAFLEIAPPGDFLVGKTYNVKEDITQYNKILDEKEVMKKVDIIRPFSRSGILDCNEYILEADGHHLNIQGNSMVYEAVRNYLLQFLNAYKERGIQ